MARNRIVIGLLACLVLNAYAIEDNVETSPGIINTNPLKKNGVKPGCLSKSYELNLESSNDELGPETYDDELDSETYDDESDPETSYDESDPETSGNEFIEDILEDLQDVAEEAFDELKDKLRTRNGNPSVTNPGGASEAANAGNPSVTNPGGAPGAANAGASTIGGISEAANAAASGIGGALGAALGGAASGIGGALGAALGAVGGLLGLIFGGASTVASLIGEALRGGGGGNSYHPYGDNDHGNQRNDRFPSNGVNGVANDHPQNDSTTTEQSQEDNIPTVIPLNGGGVFSSSEGPHHVRVEKVPEVIMLFGKRK